MTDTSAAPGDQQTPPASGGGGKTPAQGPSEVRQRGSITSLWIVILVVYLALFASTGYLAFLGGEYNPALGNPSNYTEGFGSFGQKGDDYLAFVIETLKKEGQIYEQKRELASQSFNVVLGAILGFLSASAAIVAGRPRRQPGETS